jgi:hypothetical protein
VLIYFLPNNSETEFTLQFTELLALEITSVFPTLRKWGFLLEWLKPQGSCPNRPECTIIKRNLPHSNIEKHQNSHLLEHDNLQTDTAISELAVSIFWVYATKTA